MSEIKNYGKVAITVDGEWDSDKSYDRLCVVDYKGLSYISITDNTEKGVIPSNSSQWKLLSVPGVKGDQGPKGDRGLTGITFKNVVAYTTYEPTIENPFPKKPIGGFWDVQSDIITLPEGWTDTDSILSPVWMSIGTFSSLNPDNPTWTIPQRISGEKGNNGVDSVSKEFIYCLTENQNIQPPTITNHNSDDYVPDGWNDSPKGIDEYNQVEWYAFRNKDSLGNWLDFEGPFIWSKWGINGLDGDGVQYIFRLNKGEAVLNPIKEFNIDVNSDEYQERGQYENIEYKPENWTDNPQGVDPLNTHEWCCKRKFRNGVWGEYSNPALWAKYGENGYNGVSISVKYAITDNSTEVPVLNKTNKNPGSIWGSIIPHYESPQALWEIQAYVDYKGDLVEVIDDDENVIYGWCDPILKSGVAGEKGIVPNYKTYVYKISNSVPNPPTSTDPDEPGDGWLDYPNTTGQWWQCVGVVNGMTNTVTWGAVNLLNGQDGVAQDGKYTEFRFAASNNDDAPEINKTFRDPSTDKVKWIRVDGDNPAPTVPDGGSLWQTSAIIEAGGVNLVGTWADPYRISGERGPRGYAGATGEPGIHGIDFEVLYCLGTEITYSAHEAPNGNNYTGWSWNIPEVTETYKYIWCCQGKKQYTDNTGSSYIYTWKDPFRLSGINGLGEKGVGIEDVRNYYAISNSATKAPSDWGNEGEIPQLNDDYPYLWNYEVIEYTDGTEKSTTPQVISVKGADGKSISNIIEYYYVGPEEENVTIDDYSWSTEPLFPNDIDIYLWNYEQIVFSNGSYMNTNPIRIGNYSKGSPGDSGKTIYPAGIYDSNITYTCNKTSCPYVLDTLDGNYYLLNTDKWESGQSISPNESFSKNPYKYWSKMDFYESIFAKIGIIKNGLFGSAVFNGDYMFSQHGTTTINGIIPGDYENFNPEDPFGENNSFYPNVCINFKTGETWFGKSKIILENGLVENTLGKDFLFVDCTNWIDDTNIGKINVQCTQNKEIIVVLIGENNNITLKAKFYINYENTDNTNGYYYNKIKILNKSNISLYTYINTNNGQSQLRITTGYKNIDYDLKIDCIDNEITKITFLEEEPKILPYVTENTNIGINVEKVICYPTNNNDITLTIDPYPYNGLERGSRTILLVINNVNSTTSAKKVKVNYRHEAYYKGDKYEPKTDITIGSSGVYLLHTQEGAISGLALTLFIYELSNNY